MSSNSLQEKVENIKNETNENKTKLTEIYEINTEVDELENETDEMKEEFSSSVKSSTQEDKESLDENAYNTNIVEGEKISKSNDNSTTDNSEAQSKKWYKSLSFWVVVFAVVFGGVQGLLVYFNVNFELSFIIDAVAIILCILVYVGILGKDKYNKENLKNEIYEDLTSKMDKQKIVSEKITKSGETLKVVNESLQVLEKNLLDLDENLRELDEKSLDLDKNSLVIDENLDKNQENG